MFRGGLPRGKVSEQWPGQVGFGNDGQHRSLNIGPNVHGLQRLALGNGLHARHEIAVGRRCAGKAGVNEIAVKYLPAARSEEHTSELQSLMRISYAVFCLKKKNKITTIAPDNAEETHQTRHATKT